MQNKGPLLDINKKFHIYKQQKQGNMLNEENIMISNGYFICCLKEEMLGVNTAAKPQHKMVTARTGQNNTAAMGTQ
jgi:hypothetical protein